VGFSLVAAFGVIGVSILIAVEIMTGGLLPVVTNINESYDKMVKRRIDRSQTMITITNVDTTINDSNWDHNISVENTGSISLKTSDFDIIMNGTRQVYSCVDPYLYPEDEAYFYVYNYSSNTNIKLKIITETGVSDYYEY
jgi:archaellum component FlaF (FlaF/FlaG flagellin family)